MIPPALFNAYLNTEYQVPEINLTIRIGEWHPDLDQLLDQHGCTSWAFITAFNPASKILPPEENIARHEELVRRIRNYTSFEGMGVGEDPAWEPELSLLILGIPHEEAEQIGRRFGQNTIVIGSIHGPAELRVTAV